MTASLCPNSPVITHSGLTLTLRSLAPDDLAAVMALEARVQSHPWRRSSYEDCLDGRHHCWLAEHQGQIRGFVVLAWAGGDAELLNLAVDPDWQGRGLGRALLDWAVRQARSVASVLFLEVRVSNHRAIAFYQTAGFFEVGLRPNYYPAGRGREDALILALQF